MAHLARSQSVALYKNQVKNESVLNHDFLIRLDLVGPESRRKLLKDASKLHSFAVCSVIQKIDSQA